MNPFILKLVDGFESKGWHPATNQEDKDEDNHVVIQQEAVDIEKENAHIYKYTPTIKFRAVIDNDVIDEQIKEIIQIAESSVTPNMIDWQITDIDIRPMGSTNYVIISGTYVEYLTVTSI